MLGEQGTRAGHGRAPFALYPSSLFPGGAIRPEAKVPPARGAGPYRPLPRGSQGEGATREQGRGSRVERTGGFHSRESAEDVMAAQR
ncbi:hypothetical protein GCM10027575_45990 [Phytohabitans suffuscus]